MVVLSVCVFCAGSGGVGRFGEPKTFIENVVEESSVNRERFFGVFLLRFLVVVSKKGLVVRGCVVVWAIVVLFVSVRVKGSVVFQISRSNSAFVPD